MKIRRVNEVLELNFKGLVSDLLKRLELNPVEFLVVVDGELVHESKVLGGSEDVRIFPVVSGG